MSISRVCTFYLGLMMAGVVGAAPAGGTQDRTVSVTEKIDLAVPPARAWDTIQDFMGWQAWHPAFASTSLVKGAPNARGSVRQLTTRDGAQFTEELVSHDAASRTYQYRIIEGPAPVQRYVSTLQVKERAGGSTVVWNSTFAVKPGTSDEEAKKLIAGIYRAGLDNLPLMLK